MRSMEVEGCGRPDDESAGEIDMGGRIGVITDAYDDAVTKEPPAVGPAVSFKPVTVGVVWVFS